MSVFINGVEQIHQISTDVDFQCNDLFNVGAPGNDWSTNLISLQSSLAGNANIISVDNTENTCVGSDAQLSMIVGGTSGGDPQVVFVVTGGELVLMGLDNTVSDNLTISDSANLGTNDRLRLATVSGVLSIDGVGAGDGLPTLFDEYDDAIELRGFQLANVPASIITFEQQAENQRRLAEIGVAEWAIQDDGSYHWMMRVQPMFRLLAGGIWQNRQLIEDQFSSIENSLMLLEQENQKLQELVGEYNARIENSANFISSS